MADHIAAHVIRLKNDGSNFWKWTLQFDAYASAIGAHPILHGTQMRPAVMADYIYPKKVVLPATATAADVAELNQAYQNELVARATEIINYNKLKKSNDDEVEKWDQYDANMRMVIYRTCPPSVVDAVKNIHTAAEMYEVICGMFKSSGLINAYSIWGEFFNLRSSHCSTTKEFTDKFMSGLSSLANVDLVLPAMGEIYQFINAIEQQYPDYAKARRHDLRENRDVTLLKMIHEITDEARRDDPVKTAFTAAKQKPKKKY